MRVLIDTNIALTYLSGRNDPYSGEAEKIMLKCAMGDIEGAIAFHSLSTIWYQSRRLPEEYRREWIRRLCELLVVTGADNTRILQAVSHTEFRDFEDALQDCCATTFDADYIITANIRDFTGVSTVPAITPKDFLEFVDSVP